MWTYQAEDEEDDEDRPHHALLRGAALLRDQRRVHSASEKEKEKAQWDATTESKQLRIKCVLSSFPSFCGARFILEAMLRSMLNAAVGAPLSRPLCSMASSSLPSVSRSFLLPTVSTLSSIPVRAFAKVKLAAGDDSEKAVRPVFTTTKKDFKRAVYPERKVS